MRRASTLAAAATIALGALAPGAGAATLQTLSQRLDLDAGPGTRLLTFDRFDPARGTLVQVIASVMGTMTFPGTDIVSPAQDFRAPDFRVRAAFELTVDFTGPDLTLRDTSGVEAGCDKFELGGSGTYLPCTAVLPERVDSAFAFATLGPTADAFSGFVGGGAAPPLLAVAAFETRYSDAGDGDDIARPGGPVGTASGSVRLDYLYLPPQPPDPPVGPPPAVPLPAAAPLMAVAAAALWGLARRRGR
jgi:hypothetical protein